MKHFLPYINSITEDEADCSFEKRIIGEKRIAFLLFITLDNYGKMSFDITFEKRNIAKPQT